MEKLIFKGLMESFLVMIYGILISVPKTRARPAPSTGEDKVVAYDPRRHQGMILRRRWSRHLRASSPLDRRRRRIPSFTTPSETLFSPRARTRRAIFPVFSLLCFYLARTCLSGPLHVFLSLFRPPGGLPSVSGP